MGTANQGMDLTVKTPVDSVEGLCAPKVTPNVGQMRNMFFRKRKNKPLLNHWVIAQAEIDGLPMIYRYKGSIPKNINISDYPYMISIVWEYEPVDSRGLPSIEMHNYQGVFDDALDQMDQAGTGIFMISVTGNSVREWIWYVNEPQKWLRDLHACLVGHPEYPLNIEQVEDRDWDTWKSLLQLFEEK